MRRYRKNNSEKIKEYYIKNKEKILKRIKQWQQNNPEKVREYDRKYCESNLDKIKEKNIWYRKNNRKKIRERSGLWAKNNPETRRNYENNKYNTDLKYNLSCKIRRAINHSLKDNKNGKHWETLVGYTLEDLIKHLKRTIPKGYCWQDYIEGKLQVDHKIPISVFNFDNPNQVDFKKCWALSNLQLLPKSENRIKRNKLSKPFQPALAI